MEHKKKAPCRFVFEEDLPKRRPTHPWKGRKLTKEQRALIGRSVRRAAEERRRLRATL